MPITFYRDGIPIIGDFIFNPVDGEPYLVPYGNLFVWDDAELQRHGVTKVDVPYVPQSISDRQFFQQLALDNIITQAEALDAVRTGAVPEALNNFILSLTPEEQFAATMIISGATEFNRNHPLTIAIGTAYGMLPETIDDFFIRAYQL